MDNLVAFTNRNTQGIYHTKVYANGQSVSECKICIDDTHTVWSITVWRTHPAFHQKGYGKFALRATIMLLLATYGVPEKIEYIWNGANAYVLDWMKRHFDPVSKLPIAVQKYEAADDWDAHIYILNKQKVLRYFNL